jgi:hypothetical protein
MGAASRSGRARRPLLTIRQLHACIGMLIAPSVIFFASTGLLQIYNLHEAHGSYAPAPLVEKLSAVHKDQVFKLDDHGGPPTSSQAGPPSAGGDAAPPPEVKHHKPKAAVTLLKAYFASVAAALIVSTLAGIWIALGSGFRRWTYVGLLALGTAIPVALAALSA